MDFYQTTERYKKREIKRQFSWAIRLVLTGLLLWVGWFWGNSQQSAVVSASTQQFTDLSQQNNRLQQELSTMKTQLSAEQERRVAAELEIGLGDQSDEIRRLRRRVARLLSRGVSEDQIRLALQSVSKPSRCRIIEEQDVAVATSFFAGKESSTDLLGGAMRVFVEGEAGQQATKDRPWFDSSQDVSMRVAYLLGEKIINGQLPLKMNIIADTWLLKLDVVETALNGYVNVKLSKCSIN